MGWPLKAEEFGPISSLNTLQRGAQLFGNKRRVDRRPCAFSTLQYDARIPHHTMPWAKVFHRSALRRHKSRTPGTQGMPLAVLNGQPRNLNYPGWTKPCTTLKPWETIRWYSEENHHSPRTQGFLGGAGFRPSTVLEWVVGNCTIRIESWSQRKSPNKLVPSTHGHNCVIPTEPKNCLQTSKTKGHCGNVSIEARGFSKWAQ